MGEDRVDLRIGGRLYQRLPRWQAERLRRLIAEKAVRTHDQVEAELVRMVEADRRVKIQDDGKIEVDGDVYTLAGGSAEQVRRGIADGSFSGFRTRAEREAERKAPARGRKGK